MGCCCSRKAKSGAFRHNLEAPLLDDVVTKLPANTQVVIVRLMSMNDIPSSSANYNGMTDGYAEMRLIPNDPIAGGQKQLSSIKPETLYPVWEPPELFQFIVSKYNESKVCISLYHYNQRDPKHSEPLGDALLNLKTLGLTSTPAIKSVKLISPADGKHKGEVEVMISVLPLEEASAVQEHTVYEFQRWQPVILWGHTTSPGHFMPTDPGRWCTEDGKKFDAELQFIEPPVPANGWYVSKEWYTVSTTTDPEGWQYSNAFTSPFWYPSAEGSSTYVVRRRTWHREIRKGVAPPVANPLRNHSIASSGSAGSHRNMSIGSATSGTTPPGGAAPIAAGGAGSGRRKPMFAKK